MSDFEKTVIWKTIGQWSLKGLETRYVKICEKARNGWQTVPHASG
jgi:hypothetical protein